MPVATVTATRPLPIVIQPTATEAQSRRRRVVSFSSDSIPSSSNPHSISGESWFHVSTSQSSRSSTSSHHPLPKGARPASPQPTRVIELDSPPSHPQTSHCDACSLKRSGTFSSWNLEWRGIQKVVKWAVLGDKSHGSQRRRRQDSQANKNTRHEDYTNSTVQREAISYRLDEDLPRDRPDYGVSPYICASPTSPLSPTTSATCVDTLPERYYSHSDFYHGHSKGFSDSEVHFPLEGPPSISTEPLRGQRSIQTSRYGSHVQEFRYTNVRRTTSELGHGHPYESSFDIRDTFSNVAHSTTSLDSSYDRPRRSRVAHSDIGHSSYVEYMPVAGLSSTLCLSNGHDIRSGADTRAFRNFRSIQSAIALPVSTASTGSPLTSHRRPRKLRKSLRAMPLSDKRTSQHALSYSLPSMIPRKKASTSKGTAYDSFSSETPLPPKPQPRQPRKLKKKPSPALPPLPRTNSSDNYGDPPPVPPKTIFILKESHEAPVTPVSRCYRSDASAESPPALTDASASTSPDDELHLSHQGSSITSEHLSDEEKIDLPVKRPSLLRTVSNRRWTVAVADVPDDLFIEELERLRRMGLRAGDIHSVRSVSHAGYALSSRKEAHRGHLDDGEHLEVKQTGKPNTPDAVLIQQVDTEDEMEWLYARRAILCCRELVRTERSYQERLQELADGNVSDAVPALLIQYLPAVIGVSKILSAKFNEDMSAAGVATAFLSVISTLERALVTWSGVVGEFFGGSANPAGSVKRKRDLTVPGFIAEEEMHTESGAVKVRCMSAHGHDKAYIARSSSARVLSGGVISASSSSHWLFRPAFTQGTPEVPYRETTSLLHKSLRRTNFEKERRHNPPFRDLAILPTQRVTRYALLYKDLLKHTPASSPTHGLVEKALETATILARKCDRAQDNSAFLFHH
ncbi:hypothetical protein ACEPAG_940 [Sanghuangporus baumii]